MKLCFQSVTQDIKRSQVILRLIYIFFRIVDDTALNNIDVGCCPLRSGDQSTSVTGENFNTLKPNKVSSSDEKLMDGESLYNQDHRNFLDKAFDSVFDSAKIMQDGKYSFWAELNLSRPHNVRNWPTYVTKMSRCGYLA